MGVKTPREIRVIIAECRHAGSLPKDPLPARNEVQVWIEDVIHNCSSVSREGHSAIMSSECTDLQRQAWVRVERDAQAMLQRARILGRKARITPKDVSEAGALYDTFISSMNVLALRYNEVALAREVPLVL